MKKGPRQAEAREPAKDGGFQERVPVMSGQRDVDGEALVHGGRRAADGRIPLRATMAGRDDQWAAGIAAQGFQRIENARIVPVAPAAEPARAAAGQLAHRKMRPVPVGQRGRCSFGCCVQHGGECGAPFCPVG